MYNLWILTLLVLLIAVKGSKYECGDKPADIVFVMDSSSSILPEDFPTQLKFVNDVIEMFDISAVQTQFASVSFSNWAYLDFHLNTYSQKTDVQYAIRNIHQVKGDTNTATAIRYMNDVMLTPENGARLGIPHIAIVLTDGNSNHPKETARQAVRAKARGVHVFAIGIGSDISRKELKAIASQPYSDYMFRVDDFKALQSIKNKLAIKTCQVTDPPILPTPLPEMIVDQACGDVALADVVFAVSPSGSQGDTERSLQFVKDVALGFEIGKDRVQVGLVPKDCHSIPEINIHRFHHKSAALAALDNIQGNENTTAGALRYMRTRSFTSQEGARPKAKRIAVIIVDEKDTDMSAAMKEAKKLRFLMGVELFVVGVGKQVHPVDLQALATAPAQQHVFHVPDYEDLQRIVFRVRNAICPVPGL